MLLLFKITTFLIPVSAVIVAFYSLYLNPRSKIIWLWFLTNFAVGVWGLSFFMLITAKSYDQALFFDYSLHFGSAFIPIFFLHFVVLFLRHQKAHILLILGYALSIFFAIATWIPNWLISGASPRSGFPYWVDGGFLYVPYVIFFYLCVTIGTFLLFYRYLSSDGLIKKQIFYILIAAAIGFIGGGTSFLPQLFNVYPFGVLIAFLYPPLMAYGVFLKKE